MQPFVKKVFEAVRALEFGGAGGAGAIMGMVSIEGERIPFAPERVDPAASGELSAWRSQAGCG